VSDVVFEYGQAVQLPSVIAYEQYGFVRTDLSELVVQTGSVGTAPGVYTITYTVTYGGMTKSVSIQVTVEDSTPPVLTYTGPTSLYAGQTFNPSFSALDNTGDDVTITVLQNIDPSVIGTQTLIAEATDSSGNTTTVEVEVTVLADTVNVRTLQINNQQLIVVTKESELIAESTEVFVALATTEPSASSTVWMPYTNQSFTATAPNQRVYLKLQDDAGNVIIRSSAPLFYQEAPVITTPTLPVVPEASANNTLLMIGVTTTSLVAASAAGWWFLIGKKRRQKEEENK